jgi:hypothetical protein
MENRSQILFNFCFTKTRTIDSFKIGIEYIKLCINLIPLKLKRINLQTNLYYSN